ncbi:hypothetical protein ACFC7A_03420 [Streptomyces niveus]|uniref:hypothetical protein n=1 Tax=Streptomyces niveus TaxID=193462 RepID=UPI0035DCF3BD
MTSTSFVGRNDATADTHWGGPGMGDWIPLMLPITVGIGGLAIALDCRNFGLRVYDLLVRWSPGGGIDPRFSPDVLRVIAGLLGTILLVAAGVQTVGLL